MFWNIEKLEKRIQELQPYRYQDIKPILSFQAQLDEEGAIAQEPPEGGSWDTMKVLERWEGRDKYLWLKTAIPIPSNWGKQKIVGVFDFGNTGGGGNSGFESLLYLNGQPYQGVDMNHQEVFLDGQLAGSTVDFCFRLWSGLEGGGVQTIQEHQLKVAYIACLDERTDDLYYTARAALDTIKYLEENQPERQTLLKALDRAFLLIDWSHSGSNSFYDSVYQAQAVLNAEIEKIPKNYPVTVTSIGHTHIDVAWLWRLKHTREKAARSFSTVLRLMEQYPDYTFLQTQPQLYEYIKHDYPQIYEQIEKRVQEGRWETEGGMWLEADCNLTSGESLVRQLLLGKKFFHKNFGKECEYLWLPDVFGYSWALPQILAKSGIKTFMTTKISWSQFNKMPHDTFKWRGIDGTEILTHFITTPEDEYWFYTYNGRITPRTVKGIWEAYRDKAVNQELLLSYGYGDGGGGVNREMLEMRRRLDKMPGLPAVKTGRADEFFNRLHETIDNTDQYVHTWDGELYLEYHRGTYTSQAYNKRMNRKMELLLRETEWLHSLNSVLEGTWSSYPSKDLEDSWKIVLRNQFHDIIPGSSIREVYEDSKLEYEEAHQLASYAWNTASKSLAIGNDQQSFTIFNSSSWIRNDIITIKTDLNAEGVWIDDTGKVLDSQNTADGEWLVNVEKVPSLGKSTIRYEKAKNKLKSAAFNVSTNTISTPYYEISWNENGQLTRIFDRKHQRNVLAPNAVANVLQIFEDKPMQYDAWDIDIFYQEKMKEVIHLIGSKVVENGPIRCIVEFEWAFGRSTITQKMITYAKNPRIDFKTNIDWREKDQLLKVAFPVDIRATEATYDIQYGNVKRPTHWNTSWDYARFETVAHQWADLSESGYGISLLNDCKYGHDIKDNVMRLTLLKSATYPDTEADQGEQQFTYSLLPHKGSWYEGGTVQEAWSLNNPLSYREGQSEKLSMFSLNAENVMVDAVKKGENTDEVIIRLHEFAGARGTVEVRSELNIVSWQECDLMEKSIEGKRENQAMAFDIKPYEIRTFIVQLKS
ncbi:alpha-mannosidase [Peribacillus muralis]|uniref:alpha-mannosidase n=1 Tax=Peribacillus muralis TaxID=264697 RepID=UPI001F4E1E3D|nr:alpha-mannosidase [Peribacillus muralis]MCK1995012.1 alpha-mannosidase [Peribacillus muralis]MCK2015617.1 alpha-mannosidase [Peribacillus muralis]